MALLGDNSAIKGGQVKKLPFSPEGKRRFREAESAIRDAMWDLASRMAASRDGSQIDPGDVPRPPDILRKQANRPQDHLGELIVVVGAVVMGSGIPEIGGPKGYLAILAGAALVGSGYLIRLNPK